jgi:hypothetical protein
MVFPLGGRRSEEGPIRDLELDKDGRVDGDLDNQLLGGIPIFVRECGNFVKMKVNLIWSTLVTAALFIACAAMGITAVSF